MISLLPVRTVDSQILESILLHQKILLVEVKRVAIEIINVVGIPIPEQRYHEYPYHFLAECVKKL